MDELTVARESNISLLHSKVLEKPSMRCPRGRSDIVLQGMFTIVHDMDACPLCTGQRLNILFAIEAILAGFGHA
eukprot:5232450-Pleurochrysis_carterae.AAC.1